MTKPQTPEQTTANTAVATTKVHRGEVVEVPPHVANELTAFDRNPGLAETYTLLINDIPDRADDDAGARILAAIINADSPEQINEIWESTGLQAFAGHHLLIRRLGKLPSNHRGLGYYLGIDALDETTGEEVYATSGAANVLGALIKAYTSDWLPARMVFRSEEIRSRPGQHVVIPHFLAVRVGR